MFRCSENDSNDPRIIWTNLKKFKGFENDKGSSIVVVKGVSKKLL